MTSTLRPARVPHPGATLKRELEARGLTQKDFAEIIDRPEQAISEIVQGEKRITPETARAFASAFGTSAEFWLNLQSRYDLWAQEREIAPSAADPITVKARLYERLPIRELRKRGWIKNVTGVDALEKEVLRFLKIRSLDQPCALAASFRRSEVRSPEAAAQLAWLYRVDSEAKTLGTVRFSRARIKKELPEFLRLSADVESAPRALTWIAEQGIAVAVVPHLPKSYTDGATFRRDDGTPVLGLSLRYDRIDAFWFTLLHELGHLVLGHDGGFVDDFTEREELAPEEHEANAFAQELLVPRGRLTAWLTHHLRPDRQAIQAFAAELGRHPGLVLGQLHHEKIIHFRSHRDLLAKVSDHLGRWRPT